MKFRTDPRTLFFVATAAVVFGWPVISSGIALGLGLAFGLLKFNPFLPQSKTWTPKLLSYAIIGLGFGVNLNKALAVGAAGFVYTALGISLTLLLGFLIGRWLNQKPEVSLLLATGTAICGGSAIAAVAPVINAKQEEISVSLGIVFLLNAVALFLFPPIGHFFELSEAQFGVWAALAIHDTSSVVGATYAYGEEALRIGTTMKLARALWIIPVTFLVGMLWSRFQKKEPGEGKPIPRKYPWFILGFLIAAALYTFIPQIADAARTIEFFARRVMVLALFLIGANLNRNLLKDMGFRPLLQGVVLWLIVGGITLICVMFQILPAIG